MTRGPIVLVEDDVDDKIFFERVLADLKVPNTLVWLKNGEEAYDYLLNTSDKPFIIFCDINMPLINGIELKKRINASSYLQGKSTPFVFYTTTSNPAFIKTAYSEYVVQGFFVKPIDSKDMHYLIKIILEYWKLCKHPDSDY